MFNLRKLKNWLKKIKIVLLTYKIVNSIESKRNIFDLSWYFRDLFVFSKLSRKNKNFNLIDIYPCLNDKTKHTPVEPIYFYQDA